MGDGSKGTCLALECQKGFQARRHWYREKQKAEKGTEGRAGGAKGGGGSATRRSGGNVCFWERRKGAIADKQWEAKGCRVTVGGLDVLVGGVGKMEM